MNEIKITKEMLINYVQNMLTRYKLFEDKYGIHNEYTEELFNDMIACKEMAEAIIQEPVNLGKDGVVRVGF